MDARERETADRIKMELERGEREHCFVGEWELDAVWPEQLARPEKLRRFALKNGFLLRGYEQGLGAMFVKALPGKSKPR